MSRQPTTETANQPNRPRVQQTPAELKEMIAAERTGHPFMVWRTENGQQRLLLLDQQGWRVTIGRDPAADVSLPWDAEVSRSHALLEKVGRGWTLVDDGLSRNGSFVNGRRVIGRRRLRDKDRLVFGATAVTYRETSGGTTQTASAIDSPAAIPLTPMQRKVLIALCRPVQASASTVRYTSSAIWRLVAGVADADSCTGRQSAISTLRCIGVRGMVAGESMAEAVCVVVPEVSR